jgi:ABC-2 type transport system permease protein
MLGDLLFIARKDIKYLLRARETLMWVFLMPIIFFYFIGTITGGFSSGGSGADYLALNKGENAGFLAAQLVQRLEDRGYTVVEPKTDAERLEYSRRLTIPAALTDSVLAGAPVKLPFVNEREGMDADYQSLRVGRAVYSVLADLLVSGELGQPPTVASIARLNEMPRTLALEVASAGTRREIPSGFTQAVPGIMVMFTLMIMVTSGATLLVIERRQGLLRRLACTPIDRPALALGKWAGKFGLGLIQVAFAMLAGTILFRLDWGPNLGWVALVMLLYVGLAAALGMLLGNLARTEGIAVAIGVISTNVFAALGGCWWPIEITPGWMQKLQLLLPTGWAMDAMHKLISFGYGPVSVLPHLLGMLLATAILVAAIAKTFRFE